MGGHRRTGFHLVTRDCFWSYTSRTLLGVAGVFRGEIAQLLARTAKISTDTRARHGPTPATLPAYLQRSHRLECLSNLSWLWASKYIYHAHWSVALNDGSCTKSRPNLRVFAHLCQGVHQCANRSLVRFYASSGGLRSSPRCYVDP